MFKKTTTLIILTLVLAALTGSLIYYLTTKTDSTTKTTTKVQSFEDCVNAGYKIISDGTKSCTTTDGTVYYENEAKPTTNTEYVSDKGIKIYIYEPINGATISSPLVVKGKVPGNWSFEASFPISLLDSKGNTITQLPAQLKGDWMTTDYVDFEATLTFTKQPEGSKGKLFLKKDNPSGLVEKEDSVSIDIRF